MKHIYVKDESGKKVYLEVMDEVAAAYRECLREEWRSDAREKYHTISLESGLLFLKGEQEKSVEERMIESESRFERHNMLQRLKCAVASLTPLQRATLHKVYALHMSQVAIAREEGVAKQIISKRLIRIHTRLKKILEKF